MSANSGFGGQSMVAPLRRVLVCPPVTAGWGRRDQADRWREFGYLHTPDVAAAERQHGALRRALQDAGVEVVALGQDDALSLDAVYVHDASFVGGTVAFFWSP